MTGQLCNAFILAILLLVPSHLYAQKQHAPVAAWLLPGASWKVSDKVNLRGELGYSDYFNAGLGYMQAYITINKYIVLNPGYIYFIYKSHGQPYRQEHFLLNAITLQLPLGQLLIDDRNMVWNRIRTDDGPLHYYRNRFRMTWSFRVWSAETTLYGYNEAFYSFNDHYWSRNRLAIGSSHDVLKKLHLDITYIRQWDRVSGRLHLFFMMGTWKF